MLVRIFFWGGALQMTFGLVHHIYRLPNDRASSKIGFLFTLLSSLIPAVWACTKIISAKIYPAPYPPELLTVMLFQYNVNVMSISFVNLQIYHHHHF